MDFRSLDTDHKFLRLRTVEHKAIVAYIDGRGEEPHHIFSTADEELERLVALDDEAEVEIIDIRGNAYGEGAISANLNMELIRRAIRQQGLILDSSYQGYKESMEWIRYTSLPLPKR